MKIVVDTNIVFSAILNTNSRLAQLLIYSEPHFQFYSCDYLHTEIFNHRDKLQKLTKLTKNELLELEDFVTHHITFINDRLLPQKLIDSTQKQLTDIDPYDVPFVALAKHLDAKLWTGDLKLTKGLKAKRFKNIISTAEMATLFDELEK